MIKNSNNFLIVPEWIVKIYGWKKISYTPKNFIYHFYSKFCLLFIIAFPILEEIHLIMSIIKGAELSKITDDLSHAINHTLSMYRFFFNMRGLVFVEKIHDICANSPYFSYEKNAFFDKHDMANKARWIIYKAMIALTIFGFSFTFCGYVAPFFKESQIITLSDNKTRITTRPLPFNTFVPFEEGLLPHYYWVYIYQGISMVSLVVMVASFDALIYSMLTQVLVQFQVLHCAIESLKERVVIMIQNCTDTSSGSVAVIKQTLFEDEMKRQLVKGIQHHQQLLRICKEITITYSGPFFAHMCTVLVVICVSLYQCLLRTGLSLDFLYMILYLVTMCAEFFIYCWFCENISTQNGHIRDALFSSYWVEAPKEYTTLYTMFMIGLKKPVDIRVVGMFPLNLSIFGTVMRSAYSVFSVLKSK